jgi:tetratricopeptide (TPR) repeat protein
MYKRAIAIMEKAVGLDSAAIAPELNYLAALCERQSRYAAKPLFKRALAIREQAVGVDHPDTIASMNNLASLSQAEGRAIDALPLVERLIANASAQVRVALLCCWPRSGCN